jgi:hypothetical protein
MKALAIAVLTTVALPAAHAGTHKRVTFPALSQLVPHIGETYQVTVEQSQQGSYALAGKSHPVDDTLTATFTVEVIGVNGAVITDKRITFQSAHIRTAEGKLDKDLPATGKTYVLHNSLTKPFERDDGSTISAEERYVLMQLSQLRVPEAPSVHFAGKTFASGAKVLVKHPKWLAGLSFGTVSGAELALTLTTADSSTATFKTKLTAGGKQLGLTYAIHQQGTLVVDRALARPLELSTRASQTASGLLDKHAAGTTLAIKTHVVFAYDAEPEATTPSN